MKKLTKILRGAVLVLSILLISTVSNAENTKNKKDKKNKQVETVVFNVKMNCMSCVAKVKKNIPFERGVKDLKVDFDTQKVAITYKMKKTDIEKLKKAIEKLDITVKGVENSKKK